MSVLADVRYALRSLAKNRGFAVVALLTIALGVGANTAVFSVINAVLLPPLPFPDSGRLVAIHEVDRRSPQERREISYPNFLDWQRDMRSVEGMAAYGGYPFVLETGDAIERIEAARVSSNYFEVLGIRPLTGRTLQPDDDTPGAAPVMVISEGLWAQFFHRDPSVLGRVVRINQTPTTIVGVMPSNFAGPPDMTGIQDVARLWVAIGRFGPTGTWNGRSAPWITPVIARLRAGVTLRDAQAEMDRVTADLEQRYPENRNRGATIVSFDDQYFGHVRPVLFILLGAVGLVLLIACTNLASLLLARCDVRQRELAVRAALGAARARVARLVLVESLTVSILGGLLGLLTAAWFIDVLVALSPVSLPSFVRVAIDARVMAFTFAVCTVSGLVFGLAPALIGSRIDVIQGLRLGGRSAAAKGSPSLRRKLVTAQIAFALVLVVGAGLMLRTIERLHAFDPGFQLDRFLTVNVLLPPELLGAQAAEKANAFLRTLVERIGAVPGVERASLTWDVPLINIWLQTGVRIVDRDLDPVLVRRHMASPNYFHSLGIPILEGRDFTEGDDRSASQYVAIVSRSLAQRYWPDNSALHQRLRYNDRTFEIVGVVGDIQHESLLRPSVDPDVYFSLYQSTLMRGVTLALRTSADPDTAATAVRPIVHRTVPGATVFRTRTGEDILNAQIAPQRFMSALLTIFSAVALVLTLVGVYGVAAYNVTRQTREIGIRAALGATRSQVLREVLRLELTPIGQGVALGVGAGLLLTNTLSAFLHGVSATDTATFTIVAALLGVAAILACVIPARSATRVDPAITLRAE